MIAGADDLERIAAASAAVVREPHARIRRTVTLRVAGMPCAVHFDDVAAARRFGLRYADLATDGERPAGHAFALRDPVLGPLFWSQGGPVFRWPHGDLPEHVVAFFADAVALTAFFQERSDGVLSFHAAAAGIAGAVAAIVGDTNVGKTTTTVACGRIGMRVYSDERCVLGAGATVHAFPRAINVRAEGRALLLRDAIAPGDPVEARLRAHGEGAWDDARFGDLFATWTAPEPAPLRAVFVLSGAGSQPRVDAVSPTTAVKAAARHAHGAGGGFERIARLHELFSNVACFRLVLGTPDASAHAIRATLVAAGAALDRSA